MKIKTNDNVQLISGKEKGKTGKVMQVFQAEGKVVVEGLNKIKKHMRARGEGQKGQVLELSGPIKTDKLMLICPKCGKPTRVGYATVGNDKKRVCKQCKETIE